MPLTEAERSQVLAFAQALVRTPSLTGQEGDLAALVRRQMEQMGYDEVFTDEWGSVVGVLNGSGQGSVLFDAHMDHVPVNRKRWTRDPFGAAVDGGRLWGRATSDMKGALAAAVVGAGLLAKEKKREWGRVMVSATVAEEPAEGPALVRVCERVRPARVVIMESSQLNVNIGQRGRAEIHVELFGRNAHASTPQLGVNAVKQMGRFIARLAELNLGRDALLGPAIIEVTDIRSEPYPGLSVVPHYCRATFDRRLLVGEQPERTVGMVQDLLDSMGFEGRASLADIRVGTYTGGEIRHTAFARAWKTAPDHPAVAAALGALRGAGQQPNLSKYGFCTNGSGSAGVLGIPTIGYGPGREAEAHIDDEFLELEQLYAACDGYRALARRLGALAP
jgi:putative selenium metabolism hydrolase